MVGCPCSPGPGSVSVHTCAQNREVFDGRVMAEARALWLVCPVWFVFLVGAHMQVVYRCSICAIGGNLLNFGAAAALCPARCAATFELQIKVLVSHLAACWFR